MKRLDTFVTPIWVTDLPELEMHREGWVQVIRALRRDSAAKPEQRTNRGGWRSENTLLSQPDFVLLQQHVLVAVKAALADYGLKPGSSVLNCQGWANVHDRGGHNVAHVHEGCLLSGTVYLQVPEGAGELFFVDPRPAAMMESFERTEASTTGGGLGGRRFSFHPRNLRLVVFPSWLSHGVETCDCDERISVAFNVFQVLAKP